MKNTHRIALLGSAITASTFLASAPAQAACTNGPTGVATKLVEAGAARARQDGRTHVLAASPTYTPVAVNRLSGGFMASPAAADGELFLRTKTHLYCIGGK